MRGLAAALWLLPLVASADAAVADLPPTPDAGTAVPTLVEETVSEPVPAAPITGRTVADLFAEERAVFLLRPHAAGAALVVRGFSGAEAPIRDGVLRQTSSASNRLTPLTGLDPFWIERSEIVRGMSPIRHGADALGGAIQLSGPTPAFAPEARSGVRATLLGGTDAPGFRGHLRGELAYANTAVLVGASAFSEGDLIGGARVGPQPYSSYEGAAAHAVIHQRLGAAATATLRYDFQEEDFPLTALSAPREVRRLENALRHALSLEAEAAQVGPFTARLAGGAQRRQSTRVHASTAADALSSDTAGEWSFDGTLALEAAPVLGALGALPLTFGIEGRHDALDASRRTASLSGAVASASSALLQYPRRATDTRGAVFVSAATGPAQRWGVHAGLRAELYWQHLGADDRLTALDPMVAPTPATSRQDELFSGELGFHFRPAPGWTVAARGAFTQRPPTLDEQLRLGQTELGWHTPAVPLHDPQAWFGEASSGWDVGPLRLELAYAYTQVTHPLDWRLATVGSSAAFEGQRLIRIANGVRARVHSVDGEAQLRLPGDLLLSVNGAFVHGTTLRSEEGEAIEVPMARVPPAFGAWQIRWAPPEGHYLELAFDWGLAQPRLSPVDAWDRAVCLDLGPCGAAESFTALHLRGGVRLHPNLTLSAVVQNLANATYRRHPSALAEPGFSGRLALEGSL